MQQKVVQIIGEEMRAREEQEAKMGQEIEEKAAIMREEISREN